MKVLLVQPNYYTQYPPLGLLKLSAYYKRRGHDVRYVKDRVLLAGFRPDRVEITSLFTWSWQPVWDCVEFYKKLFPKAKVRLGGVYASLMPHHAKKSGADEVVTGTDEQLDNLVPDYDLIPEWNSNVVFTSRGCIRKCSFCAVPSLEPERTARKSFKRLLDPRFNKVIFWDNNFFGTPHWREILHEVRDLGLSVDFNQGLDGRLVTDEVARLLEGIKISPVRMAYDMSHPSIRRAMERSIERLADIGIRKRRIFVYVLHNFTDSPNDFFERARDLLNWGVVAYPMRYEPLDSLAKNKHVARLQGWNERRLEMVADARRVIGFGGAFPPYEGLIKKFNAAKGFDEAFELRPKEGDENETEYPDDEELVSMGREHEFPSRARTLSRAS